MNTRNRTNHNWNIAFSFFFILTLVVLTSIFPMKTAVGVELETVQFKVA